MPNTNTDTNAFSYLADFVLGLLPVVGAGFGILTIFLAPLAYAAYALGVFSN